MKTIGTLFTGFGGVDIGAMAAGLQPLWGIEYRADVAEVANHNLGGHVIVADVLECNPLDFVCVDVLHASPPCPNFSVAKADGAETANDLALAAKVADFVTVLQPQIFTLENVIEYRNSASWRTIEEALHGAGYWVNVEIINTADFGVPQTRRRMIVRAIRGGFVPYLPQPVEWVGWYAAIADLIDDLPDSQFAPWQLARLPEDVKTFIFGNNPHTLSGARSWASGDEPIMTVIKQFVGRSRAMLMSKTADKFGDGLRGENEPAHTIGANEHGSKTLLPNGRVVSMTPRTLARFQSFPDWYELPTKRSLAAYGIGNAVPPLLYQRIIEGLVTA